MALSVPVNQVTRGYTVKQVGNHPPSSSTDLYMLKHMSGFSAKHIYIYIYIYIYICIYMGKAHENDSTQVLNCKNNFLVQLMQYLVSIK